MAEVVRRAAVVAADGRFAARVGVAMAQRYPPFEPAQVVDGRMHALHAAGWVERAEISDTIEDGRYRQLAWRIVLHEQPDALQPECRQMPVAELPAGARWGGGRKNHRRCLQRA